jgi:hypothetical protein
LSTGKLETYGDAETDDVSEAKLADQPAKMVVIKPGEYIKGIMDDKGKFKSVSDTELNKVEVETKGKVIGIEGDLSAVELDGGSILLLKGEDMEPAKESEPMVAAKECRVPKLSDESDDETIRELLENSSDDKKLYKHKETGSADTNGGWVSSYDKDELAERGTTAKECFDEDEGFSLFLLPYGIGDEVKVKGRDEPVEIDSVLSANRFNGIKVNNKTASIYHFDEIVLECKVPALNGEDDDKLIKDLLEKRGLSGTINEMKQKPVEQIKSESEARQLAVDWQDWQSKQSMSQGEASDWASYFEVLAKKFGLEEEFKENGII